MKILFFESEFKALSNALSVWYDENLQKYKDYDGFNSCPLPGDLFHCMCLIESLSNTVSHSRPFVLDGEKFYKCNFDKTAISFVLDQVIDDVVGLDNQVSILKAFNRALLYD